MSLIDAFEKCLPGAFDSRSRKAQLASGLKRQVLYPTELLAALLPQLDG
jgi:hypothetical protein